MTSLSGLTVSLAEVAYSAGSNCIKDTGTEGTCTGGACKGAASIGGTCVSGPRAVERSEMHTQSFRILEVRGTGLEIRVGAGFTCIKRTCESCSGGGSCF